jgi:lysyl endopeptidase
MPAGGRLSVYDPAYTTIRGPFTERDNEAHGQLWTPPLDGGQLVIEALLPAGVAPELLDLRLASVNRGFLDPSKPADKSTGGCNVDVVCAEANPWRDQVRSVAAVYIGGVAYCSGALINNTARDDRPFFLTASHCDIDAANAPSVVTYWNYENSTCRPLSQVTVAPGDGRKDQFLTGSIFRAAYAPSDFTLLELDDEIPAEYGVFYAGWDRRDIAPASAVAIHHPSVEEKRISIENGQTSVTTYLSDTSPGNGTHLRIADWDTGTTEGGSSGSPLFSPDGLVVGQLHGGYAACSNDSPDWYGRLYASWTGGGTASTSLASWLDPGASGAQTLAGKDPTVYTTQLLLPVISLER